jgi:hypothetical protein
MGAQDRSVRTEAVTQRATIFGHNYQDETEYDLTVGAFTSGGGGHSDLCNMLGVSTTTGIVGTPTISSANSIRVMQPHQGELVQCYIDFFSMRSATDSMGSTEEKGGLGVIFAIGDFTNDEFTTPRTSYTFEELKASWEKISGKDYPIYMASGGGDWRMFGSKINLLPEIKKADHPRFVEDGFNLIVAFTNVDYTQLVTPIASGAGTNFAVEFMRILTSITGVK